MIYTQDTNERPRRDQIEMPRDEGEFTLAIIDECIKYIAKWGEGFKMHLHILSALCQMPMKSVASYMQRPSSTRHLINNLSYYARISKLSEDALKGCYIAALLEWYRRSTAVYEDKKIEENGDVFPTTDKKIDVNVRLKMLENQMGILLNAVKSDVPHIKTRKKYKEEGEDV